MDSQRMINRQLNLLESIATQYNDNINEYNRNISDMLTIFSNTQQIPTRQPPVTNRRGTNTRASTSPISTTGTGRSTNDNSWIFSYLLQPTLEPVPLTLTEISNTTRTYVYSADNISLTDDNRCPISLDNFQTGDVLCSINGCGHKFKRTALMEWFRRNSNCPVCRYSLRTQVNDMSNNIITETMNTLLQNWINELIPPIDASNSQYDLSMNITPIRRNSSSSTQEEEEEEEFVFDSSVD